MAYLLDEIERGRAHLGADCTLNGAPAYVTGTSGCSELAPFAQIVRRDGLRAEWSWAAVARVMAAGGAFRT